VSRCFIRHRQPQGGQVHYIHAPVKTSNDRSGLQRLRLLLSAYFKTNCLDEKTVPVFIHRQCKTWSARLQRRHNVFITSRANMDTCCCRHQMTVRDLHLIVLCTAWIEHRRRLRGRMWRQSPIGPHVAELPPKNNFRNFASYSLTLTKM